MQKMEPYDNIPVNEPRETEVIRIRQTDDVSLELPVEEQPARPRPQWMRIVEQFFLGTILNNSAVKGNYKYVVAVIIMLFTSIAVLFTSLTVYTNYTHLRTEVQSLRERAIRFSEQRYEVSSHSAVLRQIRERGINLQDPAEPNEVID